MSETRRTVVPNVPNHTRIALVWGAERKASSQIERYSAGIKKLSELEIDCNKDWLKFGITKLGTLSIVSPDGSRLGFIRQDDSSNGFRIVPDGFTQKVVLDAQYLYPASQNVLDVGCATYPLRKVIVGSDAACRLKLPVGTMMCDF